MHCVQGSRRDERARSRAVLRAAIASIAAVGGVPSAAGPPTGVSIWTDWRLRRDELEGVDVADGSIAAVHVADDRNRQYRSAGQKRTVPLGKRGTDCAGPSSSMSSSKLLWLAMSTRDQERSSRRAVFPDLSEVALIDAQACAATGGMSVSWWHAQVADGKAPQPVVRRPRCTRWRLADVRSFWTAFTEQGEADAASARSQIARAKHASARALSVRALSRSV